MPKYTVRRKQYPKRDSYAKKIYKMEKKVNKMSKRMEVKFASLQFDNTVNNSGTVTSLLNAITQGTSDSNQRVGDKIRIKRFSVNHSITENVGVGNFGPIYGRLILFVDKEVNLTLASDILTNTGSVLAPLGLYQWDNSINYKILKDKKFALNTTTGATRIGSFKVNFKNDLPVQFDAGTSALIRNDVKMLVISDTIVGTSLPTIRYTVRVEYYDS